MVESGFCTFPSGRLAMYAFVTSISAFLFVLGSTLGCYFARMDGQFFSVGPYYNVLQDGAEGEFDFGTSRIGLLSYETYDEDDGNNFDYYCKVFTTEQVEDLLDDTFRMARIFAILANMLVGVSMLLLWGLSCCAYPRVILYLISVMLVAGSGCLLLTFTFYLSKFTDSPYNAGFYYGSATAVVGAVVAVISAAATAVLPDMEDIYVIPHNRISPELGEESPSAFAPGTVTEVQEFLPDGRKKIVTTTTRLDGTKEILERIEDGA